MRSPSIVLSVLALGGCAMLPGGDSAIYEDMARSDVELAAAAMQEALETGVRGTRIGWRNPQTGHAGSFDVGQTYINQEGAFCRHYRETITLVDGRTGTVHNRACRSEQGQWLWL